MRKYQDWRKAVQTVRELNNLDDRELDRLLPAGGANSMLDVLSLDNVFEELAYERLDDVLQHWETAHRLPAWPVVDWCTHVRRCRLDVHELDETVIRDAALASKSSSSSSLCRRQCRCRVATGTCLAAITKVNAS